MTEETEGVRILLVDDHQLVRLGFRLLLDAQPGLRVVGEAGDGAEALRLIGRTAPDVVLMDVRMPQLDGVEATQRITAEFPHTRVLVLTTFDHDEYAFAALRAGAAGFIVKSIEAHALIDAVRTIAAGDAVVSPRITRRLLETFAGQLPADGRPAPEREDPRLARLSTREREVVIEVGRGRPNAEIARCLSLSETTVKSHLRRIMAKLDLHERAQVVAFAYDARLVWPS
ncbi:response regulator transcription factor [Streptacidiphilus sp. N1-10]|uniref:Response regulator transcription factor n=1 Tax=Streptacidiphilus jeojiensis TaxID=3229225 RepID=A0ABV6XGL3_9ACTN